MPTTWRVTNLPDANAVAVERDGHDFGGWRTVNGSTIELTAEEAGPPPTLRDAGIWIFLAAVPSALLFTAFAVTWTGARVFDGRRPSPIYLLAGVLIRYWLPVASVASPASAVSLMLALALAIIGFARPTWAPNAQVDTKGGTLIVVPVVFASPAGLITSASPSSTAGR